NARVPTLQDLAFGAGFALMHGGPHDEQTTIQRAAKLEEMATHPELHPDVVQSLRDIADGKFDRRETTRPPDQSVDDIASEGDNRSADPQTYSSNQVNDTIVSHDRSDEGAAGPYREVAGHHVHAKSGFRGHTTYDPRRGFSISPSFMESRKWRHKD